MYPAESQTILAICVSYHYNYSDASDYTDNAQSVLRTILMHDSG